MHFPVRDSIASLGDMKEGIDCGHLCALLHMWSVLKLKMFITDQFELIAKEN